MNKEEFRKRNVKPPVEAEADIYDLALYSDSIFRSFLHPVLALYDEKPKTVFIIPLSEEGENSCYFPWIETKDLTGKFSYCFAI